MNTESNETTYEKCHFTCVYCGFDGRTFDAWMQLSIDHIRPRSCGGTDEPNNRVAACGSCNSLTSRMTFAPEASRAEMLEKKRQYVAESRRNYYKVWAEKVMPRYLERPLLPLA
ncbi:MAG TPA: HNH endonuclease signature motif containing protein [Povalibacter sp.]|uniref:HNH endonuclease n=1 Tax=Povalibacter sp. TaxID=1962978 RepID=UPI002CFD0230|nr:HNH endonuclease signature motif containing protein [Povalibacter sp.]HMN45855.1 HNH endonuclease signature motif containing protein [Povalibacter sp.]